jgi:hypothetical protein
MPEDRSPKAGSNWPIAMAVICVSLIALAAFVFKTCTERPAQFAKSLSEAAQPQVSISTIIQTSLERLRKESKLVVYTADVAVMVTKFSEKKVLYGKVDLGTTTVRLRTSGNKAQLVVPLQEVGPDDFTFDSAANRLTISLPPPRVDETVVEVQTDPSFYEIETDVGWARINKFSGDFLREQARRDLRPAVIAEASHPRIVELAKESGRETIGALLEAVIKPMSPNTTVQIEFKPSPE